MVDSSGGTAVVVERVDSLSYRCCQVVARFVALYARISALTAQQTAMHVATIMAGNTLLCMVSSLVPSGD